MPFLSPNQWRQSTEGIASLMNNIVKCLLSDLTTYDFVFCSEFKVDRAGCRAQQCLQVGLY